MKFRTSVPHAAAAFVISATIAVFNAGTVAAESVSLTLKDSFSEISADLIAYNDGVYLIRTAFGDLQVKASDVICEGPGCLAGAGASKS